MRTGKRRQTLSDGMIILMTILIIGLITGTILLKLASTEQQGVLSLITSNFLDSRSTQGFYETFLASLFSTSVFLLTAFFLGYFAIGKPFAILLPFFKGLGLGISMADIFLQNGVRGYLVCLTLILPSALISSFAIMLAGREAGKNAGKIFTFVCGKTAEDGEKIRSGAYIIKFAVLFCVAIVGAAVDALMTLLFSGII